MKNEKAQREQLLRAVPAALVIHRPRPSSLSNRLAAAYARLNLFAHEKVADFAEKLAKAPKYLIDPEYPYRYPPQEASDSTPPAREGNATPLPNAPQRPQASGSGLNELEGNYAGIRLF